ncbi:MAG: hypothetical protein JF588_11570 [Caulobacterales bacterium]|nr:hypothetical protein [Caulobacterales bacterium]
MTRPEGLEPRKVHNGGYSTDATDPRKVRALARRLMRPLRERARICGYALAEHGSMERDIDLVAIPWRQDAMTPEQLASHLRLVLDKLYPIGLEVTPETAAHGKPHGRKCWAWWIRRWTYIDLSVMPPIPETSE